LGRVPRQAKIVKAFGAQARKGAALAGKGLQGPQPFDQAKALRRGAGGGETRAGVARHGYSLSSLVLVNTFRFMIYCGLTSIREMNDRCP
jgi:hypothetical protein